MYIQYTIKTAIPLEMQLILFSKLDAGYNIDNSVY